MQLFLMDFFLHFHVSTRNRWNIVYSNNVGGLICSDDYLQDWKAIYALKRVQVSFLSTQNNGMSFCEVPIGGTLIPQYLMPQHCQTPRWIRHASSDCLLLHNCDKWSKRGWIEMAWKWQSSDCRHGWTQTARLHHALFVCMQHHTRPGTPGYLVRSQKVHYGKAGVQDKRAPLKRQRNQGAELKQIDSCRLPPRRNLRRDDGNAATKTGTTWLLPSRRRHALRRAQRWKPLSALPGKRVCSLLLENKGQGIWFANESQKENVWHQTGGWVKLYEDDSEDTQITGFYTDTFTQPSNSGHVYLFQNKARGTT